MNTKTDLEKTTQTSLQTDFSTLTRIAKAMLWHLLQMSPANLGKFISQEELCFQGASYEEDVSEAIDELVTYGYLIDRTADDGTTEVKLRAKAVAEVEELLTALRIGIEARERTLESH